MVAVLVTVVVFEFCECVVSPLGGRYNDLETLEYEISK